MIDLEVLIQEFFVFDTPLSQQQLSSIWDLVLEVNNTLGDYPLLERFGFQSGLFAIFSDNHIFNTIHHFLSRNDSINR